MIGPHVIGNPAWLAEFCRRAQPRIIKYLDPSGPVVYRAPVTIGRIHAISEEKDLADPIALARRHAAILCARAAETGIDRWEGINEPPVWTGPDYVDHLVTYECERVRLLHAAGLGAVVLNVGVGWPAELPGGAIDWAAYAPLAALLGSDDALGVHEYYLPLPGGPRHPDNYLHRCGRLFRCPYNAPIVVTECGIDIGGGAGDGWRVNGRTADEYAAELAEYGRLLARDPRVIGATVFTFGHNPPWQNFDIEPEWPAFVAVMRPIAQPTPALKQPIRVKRSTGVETMELETYLRGVVPSEVPALWPVEAVRAQAVAARSYALACIERRRGEAYDVTDTIAFQVYNPEMIHPASDQAVLDTAGVYVVE